jgi:hypothetical protein
MIHSLEREVNKNPALVRAPDFLTLKLKLQSVDDVRENVTDSRSEQRQNDDDDDGNQYQDQGVFNETLALFTRLVHHDNCSSIMMSLAKSSLNICYHTFKPMQHWDRK